MKILRSADAFFFAPITARGFSMMRVSWAFWVGAFLLMQWNDVIFYYANEGILPRDVQEVFMRWNLRFSVLDYVTEPSAVFMLYLFFLGILFCMMIGLWPRITTIISVVLLYSFHERNTMILGGGDTLFRNLGFILMFAPNIHGYSVHRLEQQWAYWKKHRALLPPPTMPIWPWRVLLWQLLVLYLTSLWYKFLGTMWLNGTAISATFHHPVFTRWPRWVINFILPFTALADYMSLIFEASWALLLIPKRVARVVLGPLAKIPLKRLLLVVGIMFHGGILLIMDAGSFSLAVFTSYFGLLRDDDFTWAKTFLNRKKKEKIIVLYDGRCGLCTRAIFFLTIVDWLGRLEYVNFRDTAARKKIAPDVTEETLDKSMHIKLPDPSSGSGQARYLTGFDAFRKMAWSTPPLWPAAPLLYLPVVAPVGRIVYARIAANRVKCSHKGCAI